MCQTALTRFPRVLDVKSPDFIKSERELNGVTTPVKPQKGSCFSKQAVSFPAVLGYLDEYGRKRPLRVFSRGVWKVPV